MMVGVGGNAVQGTGTWTVGAAKGDAVTNYVITDNPGLFGIGATHTAVVTPDPTKQNGPLKFTTAPGNNASFYASFYWVQGGLEPVSVSYKTAPGQPAIQLVGICNVTRPQVTATANPYTGGVNGFNALPGTPYYVLDFGGIVRGKPVNGMEFSGDAPPLGTPAKFKYFFVQTTVVNPATSYTVPKQGVVSMVRVFKRLGA